jgi:hypothetical protein
LPCDKDVCIMYSINSCMFGKEVILAVLFLCVKYLKHPKKLLTKHWLYGIVYL